MIDFKKIKLNSALKESVGGILRIFVFLAFVILITVNWDWLKGMFNYRDIYGEIIQSRKSVQEMVQMPETSITVPEIELNEPQFTDKPDGIEIPKIEVSAPLIFLEDGQKNYQEALKKGVVYYYPSVLPGEKGQTVILGHSAPPGWPKIDYDWIFSRLNELNPDDEIFLYYKNGLYRYLVTGKLFLKPGEEIPSVSLTDTDNVLVLLTCWPPGVSQKRIAVQALLK